MILLYRSEVHNLPHISSRSAFTLMEILASLAIMSIFTVIALSGLTNVVDDARFSKTVHQMEQIRNALVGETQRLETGLRKNYGYLGDMGALPTTVQGLAALSSMPAGATSWSVNSSYGIGSGWRGPYMKATFDQADFTKDAWGNPFVYTYSAGAATLTSYGSDGVAGGTGFAQDITISIPSTVVNGKLLGYIMASSGDLLGADQVPYSSSAEVTLYYPNGSGGFTSAFTTVSATSSGKYSFSSIPLGYATVKVWIPSSASPTQTLGPSIMEINKAATAAVPVAQDTSTVYGSSSDCSTSSQFSYVSGTASINNVSSTFTFQLSFPADFTWSGNFIHETESNETVSYFTISNASGTTSYKLSTSTVGAAGTTSLATNTTYTMSPTVISSGVDTFTFKYNSNWTSSQNIYYYQIGCQFIGIHPGQ